MFINPFFLFFFTHELMNDMNELIKNALCFVCVCMLCCVCFVFLGLGVCVHGDNEFRS